MPNYGDWQFGIYLDGLTGKRPALPMSYAELERQAEECIDCDACVEACPVDAIFAEDQLPDEWRRFIDLNAAYYRDRAA